MTSPLDLPADRAAIRRLYARGLVSKEARDAAIDWMRPRVQWALWTERMLLLIGAALILSGLVYWFAFNWARLPVGLKLGLPQAGIAVCVVWGWLAGFGKPGGKCLLMGASVLVGAALGVYGQVYQTGADPYELFVGWAALIAGWVFVSRFAGHWLLWLALLNTAVLLYFEQVVWADSGTRTPVNFALLGGLNGLAVIGAEILHARGAPWMASRWFPRFMLAVGLFFLTIAAMWCAIDFRGAGAAGVAGTLLLACMLGGGAVYYTRRRPDLPALTLLGLSACTALLTLIGRGLFEVSEDSCSFLLFGFIVLGVVGAAVWWLIRVGRGMREEARE